MKSTSSPRFRGVRMVPLCLLVTVALFGLMRLFAYGPSTEASGIVAAAAGSSSTERGAIFERARDAISRLRQHSVLDSGAVRGVEIKAASVDIKATLLSIDFHITPIADLKHVISLAFQGVKVEDRSLSGACGRTQTCAHAGNLAVLRPGDVEHSMHFGGAVRREFFDAYSQEKNSLIREVDAMVCSHPTGMCELVMPFGRPAILWATTRFEQGRERHANRFGGFVKNFRALAALPGSAVAANNMYDVHYVHYFTGIKPRYIPSHSGFPGVEWNWSKSKVNYKTTILVHGYRPHRDIYGGLEGFLAPLRAATAAARVPFDFKPLRDALGGDYEYNDLASYPAILHFPYQVSIMSFFEQYRMNIPIIAPSLTLLTRWHSESLFVSERTWDTVLYNSPADKSVLPKHADADEPFDPNDEGNIEAIRWWLQWADYYVFPHVILFDSWADLTEQLKTIDLAAVSAKMKVANVRIEKNIVNEWTDVLKQIPSRAVLEESDRVLNGMGFDDRMNHIYGKGEWAEY